MPQIENENNPAPIWGIVANVRDLIPIEGSEGDIKFRLGTHQFHSGAKVYVVGRYHGWGLERIIAIGFYRGKGLITGSLKLRYLTNFHVHLIYSPGVITRIQKLWEGNRFDLDGTPESKVRAEDLAASCIQQSYEAHHKQLLKWQASQEQADQKD
jgi:hypothetical protein